MNGAKLSATSSMRAPAPTTAVMLAVTVRSPMYWVRSSMPSSSGRLLVTARTVGYPRSSDVQKYPDDGSSSSSVRAPNVNHARRAHEAGGGFHAGVMVIRPPSGCATPPVS